MNFKKEAKIMVAILSAPLFLGLLIGLVAPVMIESSCENQPVRKFGSPDNRYEIILFQRDCGATTGFSTQVSIVSAGKKLPKRKGNIFIADDGDRPVPLGAWGGPAVEIQWIAKDGVLIEYPEGSRVFLNKKEFKDVHIEYKIR